MDLASVVDDAFAVRAARLRAKKTAANPACATPAAPAAPTLTPTATPRSNPPAFDIDEADAPMPSYGEIFRDLVDQLDQSTEAAVSSIGRDADERGVISKDVQLAIADLRSTKQIIKTMKSALQNMQ